MDTGSPCGSLESHSFRNSFITSWEFSLILILICSRIPLNRTMVSGFWRSFGQLLTLSVRFCLSDFLIENTCGSNQAWELSFPKMWYTTVNLCNNLFKNGILCLLVFTFVYICTYVWWFETFKRGKHFFTHLCCLLGPILLKYLFFITLVKLEIRFY